MKNRDIPVYWAIIPITTLIVMLSMVIGCFGQDSIDGGSQIALLFSSSIAATIAIVGFKKKWTDLEKAIVDNIHTSASAIIILLLIGAIAGTWMVSGVVPTLIYYGLKILHPSIFLVATALICAGVAIITGSSWTTIATIGVAFMGIGSAMGFSEGWIAGAIISGAYFGDKISALSDTTILASSSCNVPLFDHIKYMFYTTVPSFSIAIIVFLVAGFITNPASANEELEIAEALKNTFNITPWILIVPLITGFLIYKKIPSLITLFLAVVAACIAMVIFQPHIIEQIGGSDNDAIFRSIMASCYGDTSIDTGSDLLNGLVHTSGMKGMLNTIWLILCAMCFGGTMTGSGMLQSITTFLLRFIRRTQTIVASTLCGGIFCNICTADQYISILITGNTFRELYKKRGLENRLLSRSIEDSATVTSVLIPWNSCGMTQSTVLGVSTLTYLPYCVFNYISPLISLIIASIGLKIYKTPEK